MSKKSIADNADYVFSQLSFLDDSGNVRLDCVCQSALLCYICNRPIPRFHPTLYYLACGKPRRICRVCHENYKQNFDIGETRKKSLKKSKKRG